MFKFELNLVFHFENDIQWNPNYLTDHDTTIKRLVWQDGLIIEMEMHQSGPDWDNIKVILITG